MSIWIYVIIAFLVLYFFFQRLKRSAGMPVLKVIVGTEYGNTYKVEFKKTHPETKDIEIVRIVLNFIPKILYVVEDKHFYVIDLVLKYLDRITDTDMNLEDLNRYKPKEINCLHGHPFGKTIEGTLLYKDIKTRLINTKLPVSWYEYQLAHSIIAVIIVAYETLDDFHRDILKESLKYISDAYNKHGYSTRERSVVYSLPNEAFNNRD